jgi:uncharacterized protein (DUF58 family)
MRTRRRAVELPSPGVVFAPDFLARAGQLVARLASLRERREGAGGARLFGVGAEFVGYRPYRSGEDLRALDWNLLARLGRPYVRVAAREASESWAVLLDTSASMGVGRPGKLQLGAELATAFAALGLARKAHVELWLSPPPDADATRSSLRCTAAKRAALGPWMRALEGVRAGRTAGLGALAAELAHKRGAGRVFLIGDLLDCEPRDVLALARPSRELVLAQVLAREELVPSRALPGVRSVRWIDAEDGGTREVELGETAVASYARRLEARLDRWHAAAGRVGAVHGVYPSDAPFEAVVRDLLGRAA